MEMKHNLNITGILIGIFILSQIIGLVVTNQYLDYNTSLESGNETFKELPFNTQRPQIEQSSSFLWIMGAVIIGTLLVLMLIKFRRMRAWKLWFFLSVTLCLVISLAAFVNEIIALVVALILAVYKIYRPNFWVHNFTELFIYGGMAAIFAPVMNMFSVAMLLVLISAYDMWAVWRSKHMITLATSQTESKMFAGLMVPYKRSNMNFKIAKQNSKTPTKSKKPLKKGKSAILGGGDVGFPLLFSAVVMKTLLMDGIAPVLSYLLTGIIVITSALALFLLLVYGKKDKFYPAMPFISAGCFVGYGLVLLTLLLI